MQSRKVNSAAPIRSGSVAPKPERPKSVNVFKKPICGDVFGSSMGGGNSMLGMMYRSRTKGAGLAFNNFKKHNKVSDDSVSLEQGAASKLSCEIADEDSDGEEGEQSMGVINPRQQLAITIKNWTFQKENDVNILREGGIHALIALAGFEDDGIKSCVATALYNLSTRIENRQELLQIGSASGIITITMKNLNW
jgi:hypothetical protein